MLEYFREKFTGWVALLILGAIGLSFVFVGLNYNVAGRSFAAKVDGSEIGVSEFERAYGDQIQANPQIPTLPPEVRAQVRRNVLEQLIAQRVIDNYLDTAGIQIDDEELTRAIQQVPDFQQDGKFDLDTYVNLLELNNLTPDAYEAARRSELRRVQLERSVLGSSVMPPSAYRRYLNLAFETRIVSTATIAAETVAEEIDVTDDAVTAYYEDNPLLYEVPESADIEYVEIRRDALASQVEIGEERLRDYYDSNKDRFKQDERRQARHILILADDGEDAAEATAGEVLARLEAGEAFEALAKEYSKDGLTAEQGGDLGPLTKEQLPDELGDAVYSMAVGQVEGPIKGQFGYHIARLDEVIPEGPQPYEQVRASLLIELQDEETEGLFIALQRKLSDALFDATDIRSLAEAAGVDVQLLAGFERTGGEPFGGNQAVIDAVFDPAVLTTGGLSDMIEIDASRTAVFAVTEHREATRRPLEEVRDQIVAALTLSQSEALMSARAQQMQDAVEGGQDFAEAAEAVGAIVAEPLSLARNDESADQFLKAAVFGAAKPTESQPALGAARNGTAGFTVYRIDAVVAGRPEAIPLAERDAGRVQLVNQYGISDWIAFATALRNGADVVINEDVLAARDLFQ